MRKKKNKQLIVNVYNGLWLLFKDNPNKKFAESKLQKLYKKKTKKDPLPVLSSLERLLNENKIIKISKDRYCLKLGETLSEGIVVKTSKSSVFISDSNGEIIKIKKDGALFALTGDKLSLSQINISKGKKPSKVAVKAINSLGSLYNLFCQVHQQNCTRGNPIF